MPRSLTLREVKYVKMLRKRNAELLDKEIEHDEATKIWLSGLDKPMSSDERQKRLRIRKKAVQMAYDLALIFNAGILPREGTSELPGHFVDDIAMYDIQQMVKEKKKSP